LPEDRRRAAVETILRNAQSQEQLIADILEVQRIMAGKLRLELRTADMSDIVRAAAETVQPSADVKNIRLQLLLDLNVTPIWGDPDRLQQVVWNLLSNAIKFTPSGGSVQVRLQQTDEDCEMVVEDNGPGIAPEFLPYVFDRFRQADSSSTRRHKGLGLGLAIVRNLVEMHGGTITASNVEAPDRTGAVFTIKLPRRVGAHPTAAVSGDIDVEVADSGEQPAWLAEGPSLRDLRVLVVDDDPDARELIGTILERYGADVAVVGSAEEGMMAIGKRTPHVVLTDIEMPHEDGYSLIRRIRALPPESGGRLPAAALTAYASPSDRMKVLAAGFNMHVAKPVQPAELAMIVATLAGSQWPVASGR
jgi:CheY-like chemotaxis protein/two-component sensor histidine kinase